jgi:hypothetical protein
VGNYGYGGVATPVAATKESAGDLTAVGGCQFTFASPATAVRVKNHPNSSDNLYVAVNSEEAGKDSSQWFDVLESGDSLDFESRSIRVSVVSIFSDTDLTYGTDFVVLGFVDGM